MKRLVSILAAFCLIFVFGFTFAEETKTLEFEGLSIDNTINASGISVLNPSADSVAFASTSDTVTESMAKYHVVTTAGVVFDYDTSQYYSYCLTQDYRQDAGLYAQIFSEPKAMNEYFIQNGIHLFIMDSTGCPYAIIADCGATDLARAVGTATELSRSDAETLAQMVRNTWPGCSVEYGMMGNCLWFAADCRSTNQTVECLTFVNGRMFQVEFVSDAATSLSKSYDLLSYLTIN